MSDEHFNDFDNMNESNIKFIESTLQHLHQCVTFNVGNSAYPLIWYTLPISISIIYIMHKHLTNKESRTGLGP